MERFYNDDSEENHFFGADDNDDEGDEEEGEGVTYMDQEGILNVMHMDLAQAELKHKLLERAIEIASKSWFWRLKGLGTRMYEIELVYRQLVKMIGEEE